MEPGPLRAAKEWTLGMQSYLALDMKYAPGQGKSQNRKGSHTKCAEKRKKIRIGLGGQDLPFSPWIDTCDCDPDLHIGFTDAVEPEPAQAFQVSILPGKQGSGRDWHTRNGFF